MAERKSPVILFSAGDLSGDIYTGRVAAEVARRHPDWTLHAVGGAHLSKAINGRLVGNSSHMSAIGLCAALKIYPRGKYLSFKLRRFIERNPVDLVVLCDWGYFNCNQLRFLKKRNIPVLYYFPPRSWQRHGAAGLGIVPLVDRVATPFEWSARRLIAAGCEADWVGHPLLETKPSAEKRLALRREFGVRGDEQLVALLPGSRIPEIKVLAPRFSEAVQQLRLRRKTQFVAAVSPELVQRTASYFPAWVKVIGGRSADALAACDAAIVKTGTATLEAAVLDAPQVAVYDFDWMRRIEWMALWAWKRIPFIALPNIILQRMAIPELLGFDCRGTAIADAVTELLENDIARHKMLADYAEIRRQLGSENPGTATERTVEIIEQMAGGQAQETVLQENAGPAREASL